VDPEFGRRVEVDMSEDRMKKAWQAYKVRWEQEEEQRLILEEKKLVILLTKKLSQETRFNLPLSELPGFSKS